MLRLITTAVAIDNQRRSSLDEGAPERIDTCDYERNRLHNARAAALP